MYMAALTTLRSAFRRVPGLARHGAPTWRSCTASAAAVATRAKDGAERLRVDVKAMGLIEGHRRALSSVLEAVESCGEAKEGDVKLLKEEIGRLGDGMFMLVVTGEYNSGKSSLINALLGKEVVAEGRTPTTDRVVKVLWEGVQIVDTPGTNAVLRGHEEVTKEFVPLCDLVLFVTSADRAFSESERMFLESIRDWGKKVILVVNKMDLIEDDGERTEVLEFVERSARGLLEEESRVFAVSAKLGKEEGNGGSGVGTLERYITQSLDDGEKLRLKLGACAAVGTTVGRKYLDVLEGHRRVLDRDRATLNEMDELLKRHLETVRKSALGHFARADNVLLQTLDRADLFFDTHVRFTNLLTLNKRETVQSLFQQQVVNGIASGVQREIRAAADWLADLSARNLNETTAVFSKRLGGRGLELSESSSLAFVPRETDPRLGGERLVTRLAQSSEELSTEYVSGREGQRVAEQLASAVRLSTGLGISAIGSLAAFGLNAASFAPDVLLADPVVPMVSGVLGVLAMAAVPRQKAALRAELRARVLSVRTRLQKELELRTEELLSAHAGGVQEAVGGFRDFVERKEAATEINKREIENAIEEVERLEVKMEETEES